MAANENPYQFDQSTDTNPNALIAQQYGIPPDQAGSANITRMPDVRQGMNIGMPQPSPSGPALPGPGQRIAPDPPLAAYPFHQFLSDSYDSYKKGVGDEAMHPGQMAPSDYRKAVDKYIDGPVADMIAKNMPHNLTSDKAAEDYITRQKTAYKNEVLRELPNNLDALKSHFNSMYPADATGAAAPTSDGIGGYLGEAGSNLAGGAVQALARSAYGLPRLAENMNPTTAITGAVGRALGINMTPGTDAYERAVGPAAAATDKAAQEFMDQNRTASGQASQQSLAADMAKANANPNFLSKVSGNIGAVLSNPHAALNSLEQMAAPMAAGIALKNPAIAGAPFTTQQFGGSQIAAYTAAQDAAIKAGATPEQAQAAGAQAAAKMGANPLTTAGAVAAGLPLGSVGALNPASKLTGIPLRTGVQAGQMGASNALTKAAQNQTQGAPTGEGVGSAFAEGVGSALPMAAGFEAAGLLKRGKGGNAKNNPPAEAAATGGEAAPTNGAQPPNGGGGGNPTAAPKVVPADAAKITDLFPHSDLTIDQGGPENATPQQSWDSPETQAGVAKLLQESAGAGNAYSPEDTVLATERIKNLWAKEHGIDPSQVVAKASESAQSTAPVSADDLAAQATGATPNVGGASRFDKAAALQTVKNLREAIQASGNPIDAKTLANTPLGRKLAEATKAARDSGVSDAELSAGKLDEPAAQARVDESVGAQAETDPLAEQPSPEAAAPEAAAPVDPSVKLLATPLDIQRLSANGRAAKGRMPVQFVNPDDKLAYLYKTTGDPAVRQAAEEELIRRGYSTEQITAHGNDVADRVNKLSRDPLRTNIVVSNGAPAKEAGTTIKKAQRGANPLKKPRKK